MTAEALIGFSFIQDIMHDDYMNFKSKNITLYNQISTQKLAIEEMKKKYGDIEILDVIKFKNKYLIIEWTRPMRVHWFDLYNLEIKSLENLHTGAYNVRLQRIVNENRFIFYADGTHQETYVREFPFILECFRMEESKAFRMRRRKRFFPINKEIAFGLKSYATLIDIVFTSDNVEIKFGPMKGDEGNFFAADTDIPKTKTEYTVGKNQLVITFKKTNLHDRLKSYAIQPGEKNRYFNHVRLLEGKENSMLVLGLKKAAKFYTGEIKRFQDSSSVVFMFSSKDFSK